MHAHPSARRGIGQPGAKSGCHVSIERVQRLSALQFVLRPSFQGATSFKKSRESSILFELFDEPSQRMDKDSFLTRGNSPLRRARSFMSYSLVRGVAYGALAPKP